MSGPLFVISIIFCVIMLCGFECNAEPDFVFTPKWGKPVRPIVFAKNEDFPPFDECVGGIYKTFVKENDHFDTIESFNRFYDAKKASALSMKDFVTSYSEEKEKLKNCIGLNVGLMTELKKNKVLKKLQPKAGDRFHFIFGCNSVQTMESVTNVYPEADCKVHVLIALNIELPGERKGTMLLDPTAFFKVIYVMDDEEEPHTHNYRVRTGFDLFDTGYSFSKYSNGNVLARAKYETEDGRWLDVFYQIDRPFTAVKDMITFTFIRSFQRIASVGRTENQLHHAGLFIKICGPSKFYNIKRFDNGIPYLFVFGTDTALSLAKGPPYPTTTEECKKRNLLEGNDNEIIDCNEIRQVIEDTEKSLWLEGKNLPDGGLLEILRKMADVLNDKEFITDFCNLDRQLVLTPQKSDLMKNAKNTTIIVLCVVSLFIGLAMAN